MKRTLLLTILLAFCAAAVAAEKRPTKIWNRTGPLGDTPKHVTDAYPALRSREQGRLGQVRADERRVRGQGTRPQQVGRRHGVVEGPAARPLQREERDRFGRQAAPDDAEGEAARRIEEAGLPRLHFRRPALQGPHRLRLFRGQGQADELGGVKLVLVSQRKIRRTGSRRSTCSRSAARPRVSRTNTT